MSGLVALLDMAPSARPNTEMFYDFVETAARLKGLTNATRDLIEYPACLAAKFDTSSSLHKGIVVDPTTRSLIAAVGTVVDDHDSCADRRLAALLTDYLRSGPSAFKQCDGQFALVIYDDTEKSLVIVSDPAGLLSIYHGVKDGRVFVSTSALAVASQINAKPDLASVDFWLRTGRVLGEMTLWKGVQRVLGGLVVKFIAGKRTSSNYWTPGLDQNVRKLPRADVVPYAHSVLLRTFAHSLQDEGAVWMELTGGLDTRLVCMILEQAGIPFLPLCQGPNEHPDVRIARTLADKKNWTFRNICLPDSWGTERLNWLERAVGSADGHLDAVSLTADMWGYAQRSEEHSGAALSGGMGEIWRTSAWLRAMFRQDIPAHILADDHFDEAKAQVLHSLDQIRSRYMDIPNATEADALSCFYIYRGSSHEGAYLSAAMGQVRYVIPMALKDNLACALSVPPEWRQRSRLVRSLLSTFDPGLASIETTHGGPGGSIRKSWDFAPYFWRNYFQRALGKISPSLRPNSPGFWSAPPPNQVLNWRIQLLRFAEDSQLLNPSKMRSGVCYDSQRLKAFLAEAETENFTPAQERFLARIITLEMSMRAIGSG